MPPTTAALRRRALLDRLAALLRCLSRDGATRLGVVSLSLGVSSSVLGFAIARYASELFRLETDAFDAFIRTQQFSPREGQPRFMKQQFQPSRAIGVADIRPRPQLSRPLLFLLVDARSNDQHQRTCDLFSPLDDRFHLPISGRRGVRQVDHDKRNASFEDGAKKLSGVSTNDRIPSLSFSGGANEAAPFGGQRDDHAAQELRRR